MNLDVQCCIKISKCKFVAMATKGQTELLKKLFDFLEMPTAAHYKTGNE